MIVAFDPGLHGAMAWVDTDGKLLAVDDLPLVANEVSPVLMLDMLLDGIERYGFPTAGVVEIQKSFPKQGSSSGFKTGMGYGVILGIVVSRRIPLVLRAPSDWKPKMKLNKDKERSRQAALHRWPEMSERFKLKKDEGRAEAALLALSYLHESPQDTPSDQEEPAVTKATLHSLRRVIRPARHTSV